MLPAKDNITPFLNEVSAWKQNGPFEMLGCSLSLLRTGLTKPGEFFDHLLHLLHLKLQRLYAVMGRLLCALKAFVTLWTLELYLLALGVVVFPISDREFSAARHGTRGSHHGTLFVQVDNHLLIVHPLICLGTARHRTAFQLGLV